MYDHNALEMELMKSGVDSVAYWNVWRLTPAVYRKNKDAPWVVKNDLSKLDPEGITDRAEYVLLTTTEIVVAADQNQSRTRTPDHRRFYLTLKKDGVPVYLRASKASTIEQTTAPNLKKLYCDYSVDSLDDSGTFWHVVQWEEGEHVWGFVHEDDVDN